MYVTASYLGIEQGSLPYLFFLLTENYQQRSVAIRESLQPHLEDFGKALGRSGAIVLPTAGDATLVLEEVLNDRWIRQPGKMEQIRDRTPGILVLDTDFKKFDPAESPYLFISLRESMDEYGRMKVFEVHELLTSLAAAAHRGDLFKTIKDSLEDARRDGGLIEMWNALELKPGAFGISIDIKQAISGFRRALRSAE